MSAIISAFNPVKIARAINPVKNARFITEGIRNRDPKAIASTMYWFGGLICIPVAILNPLLMNHQYKNKVDTQQRRSLVMQEAANQWVSVGVQLLSYFGLSALVGGLLNKRLNPAGIADAAKREEIVRFIDITKILVANIGGFLGQGVIRPWLGSSFLMKWQDKHKDQAGGSKQAGKHGEQNAPKLQSGNETGPANPANPAAQQQPSAEEEQQLQDFIRSLQEQEQNSFAQQQQQPAQAAPAVSTPAPEMPAYQSPTPMQSEPLPFQPSFQTTPPKPLPQPANSGFPAPAFQQQPFYAPQPIPAMAAPANASDGWLSPLPPPPAMAYNNGYNGNPFAPRY